MFNNYELLPYSIYKNYKDPLTKVREIDNCVVFGSEIGQRHFIAGSTEIILTVKKNGNIVYACDENYISYTNAGDIHVYELFIKKDKLYKYRVLTKLFPHLDDNNIIFTTIINYL